jgi:hypothetical protein
LSSDLQDLCLLLRFSVLLHVLLGFPALPVSDLCSCARRPHVLQTVCIDKKENQIYLIYKEIQNGAVAKSYMINCLLIYGEIFAHFLIYSIRKPFLIYDFATAPL